MFSFEMNHLEGLDAVATGAATCDVIPRIRGQEMNQEVGETSEVLIVP